MPVIQSSYTDTMPKGQVGRRVNSESWNTVSRSNESASAIGYGVPVTRGAGENGCLPLGAGTYAAAGANGVPAPAGATIGSLAAVYPAKVGDYDVRCIVGGAGTASKWEVRDPAGELVGVATGNTAFSAGGLSFTITDAGTDPSAGEAFTVTVTQTGDPDILGITESDVSQPNQNYPQYATVPVMERGVIWVLAGGSVTQGAPAFFDLSDQRWKAASGADQIRVPGAEFDSAGGNGDLVKVRYRRPVA